MKPRTLAYPVGIGATKFFVLSVAGAQKIAELIEPEDPEFAAELRAHADERIAEVRAKMHATIQRNIDADIGLDNNEKETNA